LIACIMAQSADVPSTDNAPKAAGYPVKIYVYDLSQGMASMYSQQLIGKQVDGIWHTSIIVYEKEYFYGGGIQSDTPGTTPYGKPLRTVEMGVTGIPQSVFHQFLREIAPRFSMDKYDLFKHNCNTFANEAMNFLNGKNIPEYITGLPDEFLNSAAGQMLKPMIDQMQQGAMAQYGDWGGVGLAAKPNLPPVNAKYDVAIDSIEHNVSAAASNTAPSASESNANGAVVAQPQAPQSADTEMSSSIEVTDDEERDDLKAVLKGQCGAHRHHKVELKVLGHELSAKMTADSKNGKLYVAMMSRNAEMTNPRQQEAMRELVTFLDRKAAAKKKGLKLKLSVKEGALEILDEMLLMTESEDLFPIVSVLRLLLVFGAIRDRYTADFMIIQQILYKIGIPFEEEVADEAVPEEKADALQNDDEEEMNFMDIHLLQFTAISAVSHLYHGKGGAVEADPHFINLGVNALRVRNVNVRLSAARLLFNIFCEMKRQYVLKGDGDPDADSKKTLLEQMERVCGAALKHSRTEDHVPTVYRLMCIVAVACYCGDGVLCKRMAVDADAVSAWKGVHVQSEAITALQDDLKSLFS